MIPIPLILAAKNLIPWRPVLISCLGLTLFAFGHNKGAASVQAKWDTDKLAQATERADDLAKALQVQQSLQSLIDQAKKDRRDESTRIDRLYAAAVDSMRDRPEARASAGVPAPTESGAGCTGAGLARPDAGFLAGYAADAARVQAALHECRAGYQAAKDQLDGLAGDVNGRATP